MRARRVLHASSRTQQWQLQGPWDSSGRGGLLVLAAVVAFGFLTGCLSSKAPRGWLPDAEEVAWQGYGGWAEVTVVSEKTNRIRVKTNFMGELIALDDDSVYVLVDEGLRATSVDSVWRIRLFYYNSKWGELSGWTFLGILSTASHGWFAPLSAPIWLISGSMIASTRSKQPMLQYTVGHSKEILLFDDMPKYARFPQGLPRGVRDGL